jgi:predicted DNA-binding transcriptional regulator YafY
MRGGDLMKIDRLLGIITTLLQKGKVTAPYLAEKFEVSRRTILRDLDDICMAGIPIVTTQGGDGGISIAEGYKLDKSILTTGELQSILTDSAALRALKSRPLSNGLSRSWRRTMANRTTASRMTAPSSPCGTAL